MLFSFKKFFCSKHNTHTCICKLYFKIFFLALTMEEAKISPIEQYVIDSVREMRIKKGISQAELANLLNVSIGFIGNVENPKYRAKYNLNHIHELAKIFKCSPKDFLPSDILKEKRKKSS